LPVEVTDGEKRFSPSNLLSWFKKHESEDRMLLRCQCGELYWEDSPNSVMEKHVGHRCSVAMGGSFFELAKMKLGLIK